jgi:hypothetical protein
MKYKIIFTSLILAITTLSVATYFHKSGIVNIEIIFEGGMSYYIEDGTVTIWEIADDKDREKIDSALKGFESGRLSSDDIMEEIFKFTSKKGNHVTVNEKVSNYNQKINGKAYDGWNLILLYSKGSNYARLEKIPHQSLKFSVRLAKSNCIYHTGK